MKIFLSILFMSVTVVSFGKTEFGAKITLENPITIDKAISQSNFSKEILVKSKVNKVCKKKGCWMTLNGTKGEYRVTFKGYDFFVPVSLVGKEVLVQGKLEKKEMTLKETKHYIEDEGGDPDKVKEARTEYRIVASAIKVLK